MIACTGHTWEQIDIDWDIPRLLAFKRYSASHPPLHLMVAAYFGIKPKDTQPETPLTPEQHAERLLKEITGFF